MNARTKALTEAGVSIWLDDLSRDRIQSGSLASGITELNISGVTTNPTIFANAISVGDAYRDQIKECAARGMNAEQTIFELMCTDVSAACDVLRDVYDSSGGVDGRVSIEVSPAVAHDTAGTVDQASELWHRVARPNAMIKIPATLEGLEAISETIARGISVNVTLMFSLTRYRQVINAYLVGLERARAAGLDLSLIHSVASFFVSRVDTLIDPQLEALGTDEALQVMGQTGLANARLAHEIFAQGFASERANMLLQSGANLQRPLWASTGVKDKRLSDTLYVEGLVTTGVVNTIPEATLLAFADHGQVSGDTISNTYRASDLVLNTIDSVGIDYVQSMNQLEQEGLQKFDASWAQLIETVDASLQEHR